MKILQRQIINNLSVGLIPILLIISIIFWVNKRQAVKSTSQKLVSLIESFNTILDSDLSKYRDYAYFVGAESEDYIVNGRFITTDFPVNIESFDFRLYEVFFGERLLYHDQYSWQDHIYYAPPDRVKYIWKSMASMEHSIDFKMSYPEILSNTLVLRNCALLTLQDFNRVGFASVISPLDVTYLSALPFINQDITLFIQTSNGVTFSDPEMNTLQNQKELMKEEMGKSGQYSIKSLDNKQRYYYYKQSLYTERLRVSNRFVINNLADVGILYNYNAMNKEFFLYRRIIFIILIISVFAFPVISYFSGKRISTPIYNLKNQVDRFKKDYTQVPEPPQITDEISMLQQSFSEMSHAVIQKSEDLTTALTELALANEALGEMTIRDGLTGVNNRLYFDQKIESEIKRAGRLNETLSLMMIDIDFFKKINDTYGHEAGDECLRQVALVFKKHANRSGDAVTRYGGEEFSVILPNTDIKGAQTIAERMRKDIESTPMTYKKKVIKLTVSIGIAGFTSQKDPELLKDIIAHADSALYQAKESGRNKVVVYKKKSKSQAKK